MRTVVFAVEHEWRWMRELSLTLASRWNAPVDIVIKGGVRPEDLRLVTSPLRMRVWAVPGWWYRWRILSHALWLRCCGAPPVVVLQPSRSGKPSRTERWLKRLRPWIATQIATVHQVNGIAQLAGLDGQVILPEVLLGEREQGKATAHEPGDQPLPGFESVSCALCGGTSSELIAKAPDWDLGVAPGMWFQVVRCRRCGLSWQNPRPSPEQLLTYYPQTYYAYRPVTRRSVQGIKRIGHKIELWSKMALRRAFFGYPCPGGPWQRWILQLLFWPLWMRMRLLGKDLKVVPYAGQGRFLDVGCGTGRDLGYQRTFGLKVAGIEPNASAAQVARQQYGLDVRAETLDTVTFPGRSFDIVHLSHVFEHVPNPGKALDTMRRLLDSDGRIILKVPNIASASARRFGAYWRGLELPRHLYHFSRTTITALLERHGFVIDGIHQDLGAWGIWRESERFEARQERQLQLPDTRWRNVRYRLAEWLACCRDQGSVIVVSARKGANSVARATPCTSVPAVAYWT